MKKFHQYVVGWSKKVVNHMQKHHKKYLWWFFAWFAVVKMAKLFVVAAWIVIWLINTQNISAQESWWECTVTFDSNRWTMVNDETVVCGNVVSQPTNPELPWYRFGWWYLSWSDTVFDFDNTTIISGITLYATPSPVLLVSLAGVPVWTVPCLMVKLEPSLSVTSVGLVED